MCYSKYSILIAILTLPNIRGARKRWIEPDGCCYLILDNFDPSVLHKSLTFPKESHMCRLNKYVYYSQGGTSPPWVSPYVHVV